MSTEATATVWDKGLVGTVPMEVYLAYEDRAKAIVAQYAPYAPIAIKNVILRFALEARLAGVESAKSGAPE